MFCFRCLFSANLSKSDTSQSTHSQTNQSSKIPLVPKCPKFAELLNRYAPIIVISFIYLCYKIKLHFASTFHEILITEFGTFETQNSAKMLQKKYFGVFMEQFRAIFTTNLAKWIRQLKVGSVHRSVAINGYSLGGCYYFVF